MMGAFFQASGSGVGDAGAIVDTGLASFIAVGVASAISGWFDSVGNVTDDAVGSLEDEVGRAEGLLPHAVSADPNAMQHSSNVAVISRVRLG